MPLLARPFSLVDRREGPSRPSARAVLTAAGSCLVAADRAFPDVGIGPAYVPLVAG